MRDELFKIITKGVAILVVIVAIVGGVIYYDSTTDITGQIVGKHTRGYKDEIHYFTISGDDKVVDVEVTAGSYKKYSLMENVFVDYDWFQRADSIVRVGD